MTSAFAIAIDGIFRDPHIARDAVYIAQGGTQILIRVVTRRADEITEFELCPKVGDGVIRRRF
jgi:hypothetical protein